MNQVLVGQEDFATAVSGESELFHDSGLLGLWHRGSVEVGALSVSVSLEFLKALLVIQPFVGQGLSAIHTSDGNDHRTYFSERIGERQVCFDGMDRCP